jgi:hypothetical protein
LVGDANLKYINGDFYVDSLIDFMPSGKGTYRFKSGEKYEGDFQNLNMKKNF